MAAYARQAVARSASGWTVSGNTATLFATATFPAMSSGSGGTVTHFGVGLELAGSTQLAFFGAVTPNISVVAGVTPKLDSSTVITQASDGMNNAAATAFLTLFFNNSAWTNVGNAGGLLPSSVAGSLYLSLHVGSPGEGGTASTNEISYS